MKHALFVLPLIASLLGCADTGDQPIDQEPESEINFLVTTKTLSTKDQAWDITLSLTGPLPQDGHINVLMEGDAIYSEHFETSPTFSEGVLELDFSEGQKTAVFTVLPKEVLGKPGTREVTFTLQPPTGPVVIGAKHKLTLSIHQPDEPSETDKVLVSFAQTSLTLPENQSAGIEVAIAITGSVPHSSKIGIQAIIPSGITYGEDFITSPALVNEELALDIYAGLEQASFQVIPINDQLLQGDFEIGFRLFQLPEGIQLGAHEEVKVIIEEDDEVSQYMIHSIAELKAKFDEYHGDWYLPEDYYIRGVVTSGENVINNKVVYIQDGTDGIMLVFVLEKLLKLGDEVIINLKNGVGRQVNGQPAIDGVADRLGVQLATGAYVIPETITLEQLASGAYKGKKVKVEQVKFNKPSPQTVWSGTRQIENEQGQMAYVLTQVHAGFGNDRLPDGAISLVGIVGEYNRLQPQHLPHDLIK